MKLQLSTDFASPHHWERLVTFAKEHGVQRLVFWGDYAVAAFTAVSPAAIVHRFLAAALLEARGRHFTGQPTTALESLAPAWRQLQPHNEWRVAAVLLEWHKEITQ